MKRSDVTDQFPEATSEQIDALLNIHSADIGRTIKKYEPQIEAKDLEIARLLEIEAKFAELEKANMTAEEQASAAIKAAEKTQREFSLKSSTLEVERKFVEAGLSKDAYEGLLSTVVGEDAEASVSAAEKIISLLSAQRESAASEVRKELLGTTPTPDASQTQDGSMTKDKFLKLNTLEQTKFITENPNWKEVLK
jgi:hypothetical protein